MIAIAAAGCNSSNPTTPPDGGGIDGGGSACAAGTYRWAAQSTGTDDEATGAAFDHDGNLWVTGEFLYGSSAWGAFSYSNDDTAHDSVFVAELDPTGTPIFARQFTGNAGENDATRIRVAPNGHLWVGGVMDQTLDIDGIHLEDDDGQVAFLVELDPATGSAVSALNSGMSNDAIVNDIAIDASGDVYIVGHYNGKVTFGSLTTPDDAITSDTGVYVAKYSPTSGDFVWLDGWIGSADGTGGDARGVALTPDGGLVVTGTIDGSLQFGDTLVGNGDTFAGSFFLELAGSDGSVKWASQLVPSADGDRDETEAIAVDGSGYAYVTGYGIGTPTLYPPGNGSGALAVTTSDGGGGTDVLLAKLAPDGTPVWFQAVGNGFVSRGDDVAVAGQALYLSGRTGGGTQFGDQTLDGTAKLFVAGYDLAGSAQWVQGATTTDNSDDEAYAVAPGSNGLAVVGHFDASAETFGSATLAAPDDGDAFAALLCE